MADSSFCTACARAYDQNIQLNPEEHTNAFYAELLDVSEATIRRHYKHGEELRLPKSPVLPAPEDGIKESKEESSNGARSVTGFAAIRHRPVTLEDAREWVRSSGDDPEDYIINVKSIAYGEGLFSNGMWARPKPGRAIWEQIDTIPEFEYDPAGLLSKLRGERYEAPNFIPDTFRSTPTPGQERAFVVSLNDTQFGKSEGGGTQATLGRISKYLGLAVARIDELRGIGRGLDTLVIIGGGDIVEGCTIYPNQAFSLDLDRRGQINTAVSAILDVIDTLAPLFQRVIVLATRGNHGENRINGNRTTLYDNDDTLVFEMAKQATDRDPELDHVEYVIAQSEPGVYVDIAGWRLATTHGDIYGKGVSGATQDKKAQAWYKNMAMARNPIGQADVFITHHFHHDKMSDWGACLWRQTPALDGGSAWFEQTSGEYSLPGMLTFVMTPEDRYSDEAVLR